MLPPLDSIADSHIEIYLHNKRKAKQSNLFQIIELIQHRRNWIISKEKDLQIVFFWKTMFITSMRRKRSEEIRDRIARMMISKTTRREKTNQFDYPVLVLFNLVSYVD